MKKLLAALILYHFNTRILHWKLTGTDFDPVHELLGDYYDQLGVFIDDIAEIGLILEINPINIAEAITVLENDGGDFMMLNGSENLSSKDCFEKIKFMFGSLISIYEELYKDESIPADVINKLQEHSFWLRKELSFKNVRRLM